jgi:ABC-2 type transport system ATP-binding protein
MADAIAVRNLGIKFQLNARGRRRRRQTLRQTVAPASSRVAHSEFWALRHISFTVKQGDAVGVIGRNGSGKSTLLRLVAGVLLPDEGTVHVHGGVGAMLELSAGFVGALTARDNVYLLSALHGFTREQVDEMFDEIVSWAGVEQFVDTPVRHFSSGMRARLAFSVVSRLDEPILLVDEALAVGDRAFRRKCAQRIEDMLADGRTLLLVSHNENDLRRLCRRALYIRDGGIATDGSVDEVLAAYQADSELQS